MVAIILASMAFAFKGDEGDFDEGAKVSINTAGSHSSENPARAARAAQRRAEYKLRSAAISLSEEIAQRFLGVWGGPPDGQGSGREPKMQAPKKSNTDKVK